MALKVPAVVLTCFAVCSSSTLVESSRARLGRSVGTAAVTCAPVAIYAGTVLVPVRPSPASLRALGVS